MMGRGRGFPLSPREVAAAAAVLASFGLGLLGLYLSMPALDYGFLKLPRTLEDIRILRTASPLHLTRVLESWISAISIQHGSSQRDHLESYTSDYTIQVLMCYFAVYIFMQTFMIPGTVFMSLLAGALFGVAGGMVLVILAATAGASSCYFLSKMIGRPLVFSLWPDKLSFFQDQVARRKDKLLNYMLFLRVTPTLPNTFINMASPIVDVPYRVFFLATSIGLIPAAYVTVRAGTALGELKSVADLYDFQAIATLFFIGIVTVTPTLVSKGQNEVRKQGSE